MYKFSFLLFLNCLLCHLITAQKLAFAVNYTTTNLPADNDIIYYSTGQKLSWVDFKGDPVETGNVAAITSSGVGFNLGFHQKGSSATLMISVYCSFSKKKSWVKSNRKTEYILNHEQHHFDISYISTNNFIQKLRNAAFTISNYRDLIQKIYTDCSKEMENLQNQYDNETQNGQLADKQEEWSNKINKQIVLLNSSEKAL